MENRKNKRPAKHSGLHSEIFYFDDDGNAVDEKDATQCVIRECNSDGELIRETWAFK